MGDIRASNADAARPDVPSAEPSEREVTVLVTGFGVSSHTSSRISDLEFVSPGAGIGQIPASAYSPLVPTAISHHFQYVSPLLNPSSCVPEERVE